jgi:hypothetical protein
MKKSVQDQILRRIRAKQRGSIFVPVDFLDLGSRAAIDQALSRIVRAGVLRRLARGVYDRPKQHPLLGALPPSLPSVAAAIARSTGSQIQVSGPQAANQLGLSTQVPARLSYLTNGATRSIRVGSRVIDFRHASPRALAGAGTVAGLVIQALRYLGRHALTADVIASLRNKLRDDDSKALKTHVPQVPAWMRPALSAITQQGTAASAA